MTTFRVQADNITVLTLIGGALGFATRMCVPSFPWWAFFFTAFAVAFVLSYRNEQSDTLKTALYALVISGFLAVCGWLNAVVQNTGLDAGAFVRGVGAPLSGSLGGFFYGSIVFIISAAFFMAYSAKGRWNADYMLLDQFAWDRPLIYVGAWFFVGLFWAILGLWMVLFSVLGIPIFKTVFTQPWFISTAIGAAFALGAALLVRQEGILASTRSLVETLGSVLTPMLALLVTLFIVVLPVTGLGPIWETGHTSAMVATLIVFSVLFINAIIRREGCVANRLYALSARVLAVALPVLALLAFWALAERITTYGLTPRRIDAVVLMGIASLYAVTYAVSALTKWRMGWEAQIRRVNVVNALAVLVVAAIMTTPIVNSYALSAWQQKNALLSGRIAVSQFDFAAMKFRLGEPGKKALEDIRAAAAAHAQGPVILEKLAMVDKADSYYDLKRTQGEAGQEPLGMDQLVQAFAVLPAGTPIPDWLADSGKKASLNIKECQKQTTPEKRCYMVVTDLYGDAAPEVVVFGMYASNYVLHRKADGTVTWNYVSPRGGKHADLRKALAAGQFDVVTPDFKILKIGDQNLPFVPEE